jgi:hypothetical protein
MAGLIKDREANFDCNSIASAIPASGFALTGPTDRLQFHAVNSGQAQMVHLVVTLGNNLIAVNPYVAIPGQNIHMRS